MHYYSSWKLSERKISWISHFCSLSWLLKIGVINWILAFPLEWRLCFLLKHMVDVHEREQEIKSSELLAWLLWPSGYWQEWAAFQWGCLMLVSLGCGISPLKAVSWLLVGCRDLAACLLLTHSSCRVLLKPQNVVCILQVTRFFFLQAMILVGNLSWLIQSITNVIIKCSLISILIWWGDNSFFFITGLCLLKILWPLLQRNHIIAHP